MRVMFAALCCLTLTACATTGLAQDPRALAQDVYRLSGGLEEARLALRYGGGVGLGDLGSDVGARCRKKLGENPSAMARAACDIAQAAADAARAGGKDAARAGGAALDALESRAIDAMVATYTPAELVAMRRYYASPEGRSVVAKRQQFWANLVTGTATGSGS
jgi:hypothetical protein